MTKNYRKLAIKEQELLMLQESTNITREINCATKRAQRTRIEKGHEASVVLACVDYDADKVHDPDETINALILVRYANRRDVAVLNHPEILYVASEDDAAQVGDDEREGLADAPRLARRGVKKAKKRHMAVTVSRELFDAHTVPKVNPLYGRLTVPAGTTDFSPFMKSIVPYSDLVVDLDRRLRTGEDEGVDSEESGSTPQEPSNVPRPQDVIEVLSSADSQDTVSEDIVSPIRKSLSNCL